MKHAIEMKNISYAYQTMSGENSILNNVNLTINYGEITLIAGGSGSGKSTLFYIMNGVIPHNYAGNLSGDVFIDGENINNKSIGDISRKIGSVFQNAEEQIIQKYVKDEIAFGPENLGASEDEIHNTIHFLSNLLELNPDDITNTLSGGQKQRLITAATLALKNDIVILDEPLANLDRKSSMILMKKLTEFKKSGKAIVIVEHRLDMVMDYIDTIYHLEHGSLVKANNNMDYLANHTTHMDEFSSSHIGNDILFDIKNINYSIKNTPIINNMNFTINKGDRILILGDNGCGKTTITKIIARLLTPTSGDVFQNIDRKLGSKKGSKSWFQKVAYVFQNPHYQLFMPTVKDELEFSSHSSEYVQKIIDMFDLSSLLDYHPHALSQGQKRKLSIATMLATKPEVLILDEPTVGQDYDSLKRLVTNINQIHSEEHNTIITITHDIRCAKALCNKVIIIEEGRVKCVGGHELIHEYFHMYY